MTREYDVMVAGYLCLDIIPRFPDVGATELSQIFRPATNVLVGEAAISTGGPVSNTGIGLEILGHTVRFCARLGDDIFGGITVELLRKRGNADGISVVSGTASPYAIAIAPPGIDRMFVGNPATNNDFCAADLDPEAIARCRHFHFGYPPLMRQMYENEGAGLEEVMKLAKRAGATTSLDMAPPDPTSDGGKAPWPTILERVLPHVDIFLPSVEEALYMLERDTFMKMKREHNDAELLDFLSPGDFTRLADKLLACGTKMTALKTGHRGFYFKTSSKDAFGGMGAVQPADFDNWSERELWCPAFQASHLASATGSGDSSIAGFLSAFFRGLPLEKCLKYANCVGWQNLQELDAISGIRSWQETTDALAGDFPMNDVHVDAPGWQWSEPFELWSGPGDPLSASFVGT